MTAVTTTNSRTGIIQRLLTVMTAVWTPKPHFLVTFWGTSPRQLALVFRRVPPDTPRAGRKPRARARQVFGPNVLRQLLLGGRIAVITKPPAPAACMGAVDVRALFFLAGKRQLAPGPGALVLRLAVSDQTTEHRGHEDTTFPQAVEPHGRLIIQTLPLGRRLNGVVRTRMLVTHVGLCQCTSSLGNLYTCQIYPYQLHLCMSYRLHLPEVHLPLGLLLLFRSICAK